ncbi:hypothetical protein D3C80_1901270 [compost metagenome]
MRKLLGGYDLVYRGDRRSVFVPGGDIKTFQVEIQRIAAAAAAQIQRLAGRDQFGCLKDFGMGGRQGVFLGVVIIWLGGLLIHHGVPLYLMYIKYIFSGLLPSR